MVEIVRDPVIEEYKKGVDRTLIRANLKLSVTERLEQLRAMAELHEEFRRAREKDRPSDRRS